MIKMKNSLLNLSAFLIISTILIGCGGSSAESDAKKVAAIYCEAQELIAKAANGDASTLEESMKLTTEAQALYSKLEGKYTSGDELTVFTEVYLREIKNCN